MNVQEIYDWNNDPNLKNVRKIWRLYWSCYVHHTTLTTLFALEIISVRIIRNHKLSNGFERKHFDNFCKSCDLWNKLSLVQFLYTNKLLQLQTVWFKTVMVAIAQYRRTSIFWFKRCDSCVENSWKFNFFVENGHYLNLWCYMTSVITSDCLYYNLNIIYTAYNLSRTDLCERTIFNNF